MNLNLTPNRTAHSKTVATTMRQLVLDNPQKYPLDPNEMFILGMMHDLGYGLTDAPSEHAHVGGIALKARNYKYWKEVYYHGVIQNEYKSTALDLLNTADLLSSSTGECVQVEERISDIASRYGEDSVQVKTATELAKSLGLFK